MGRALLRYLLDVGRAWGFFTRLPGGLHTESRAALTSAFRAAPVVGAVVGLVGGGVYAGASLALPALVAGLLAVAAQLLATGAFHEDGWADFWDGLGGASREKRLAIMRDSRVGTFGAAALILALGLKAALIAEEPAVTGCLILIITGALARAALVVLMKALSPAREDGLSAEAGAPSRGALVIALLTGLAPAFLLGPLAAAVLITGAIVGTVFVGAVAKRHYGGQTGDVLGASAIAAELVALLLYVAIA